jgi:hypothetical protein
MEVHPFPPLSTCQKESEGGDRGLAALTRCNALARFESTRWRT